jgi:hypothetical protein
MHKSSSASSGVAPLQWRIRIATHPARTQRRIPTAEDDDVDDVYAGLWDDGVIDKRFQQERLSEVGAPCGRLHG